MPANPTCSGSFGRGGVEDLPAWGRNDTGLCHQQPTRGAALQRLRPAGRALPRNIKKAKKTARIISAMITVTAMTPVKLLLSGERRGSSNHGGVVWAHPEAHRPLPSVRPGGKERSFPLTPAQPSPARQELLFHGDVLQGWQEVMHCTGTSDSVLAPPRLCLPIALTGPCSNPKLGHLGTDPDLPFQISSGSRDSARMLRMPRKPGCSPHPPQQAAGRDETLRPQAPRPPAQGRGSPVPARAPCDTWGQDVDGAARQLTGGSRLGCVFWQRSVRKRTGTRERGERFGKAPHPRGGRNPSAF